MGGSVCESTLWYIEHMTRNQAIAIIEKSLSSADEATLNAAAELVQAALAEPSIFAARVDRT